MKYGVLTLWLLFATIAFVANLQAQVPPTTAPATAPAAQVTYRVTWKGTVQGVGFRAYLKQQAQHAAVTGWVANLADGAVCAELTGAPAQVAQVIQATLTGPAQAVVTDLHLERQERVVSHAGFKVDD
jgi:acylphosphatase